MRTEIYYKLSFILFILLWAGAFAGKLTCGGDAIVPIWFMILTLIVILNTIVAMIMLAVEYCR